MIGYEGHCHLVEDECSKCTMLGANMNFCVTQTEQEFNLTIQFPEGSIPKNEYTGHKSDLNGLNVLGSNQSRIKQGVHSRPSERRYPFYLLIKTDPRGPWIEEIQ